MTAAVPYFNCDACKKLINWEKKKYYVINTFEIDAVADDACKLARLVLCSLCYKGILKGLI